MTFCVYLVLMGRGRIAMKIRFVLIALTLILIDQIIKIIIASNFMEPHVHIDWIEGILAFCPTQNIHLSWIPSVLDYMMPVYMAVTLIIISILLAIALYRLITYCSFNWSRHRYLPGLILLFTLSGASCAFIDVVFWGGSIDYIQLFNWFIFDLKDVYSSLGSVFVLLYLIAYYKQYYALSKEDRKEYNRKTKLLLWLKAGLPLKPAL